MDAYDFDWLKEWEDEHPDRTTGSSKPAAEKAEPASNWLPDKQTMTKRGKQIANALKAVYSGNPFELIKSILDLEANLPNRFPKRTPPPKMPNGNKRRTTYRKRSNATRSRKKAPRYMSSRRRTVYGKYKPRNTTLSTILRAMKASM